MPAPLFFSGRHPVDKSGKAFDAEISLVLPSRSDGYCVPCYVQQQFVHVDFWVVNKLTAQHNCHFEVDLVGVNAFFRLTDNDLAANAASEVECGQAGVYLLFRESVRLAV